MKATMTWPHAPSAVPADPRPRPRRKVDAGERSGHSIVDPRLIEDAEYEWVSPVSMPGLLVEVGPERTPRIQPEPPFRGLTDEVLVTEDGDMVRPCQLPGGIDASGMVGTFQANPAVLSPSGFAEDEYSAQAATQLPGLIAAAYVATPETRVRGLCASCIHASTCSFPRPEGGVWRCEEYE